MNKYYLTAIYDNRNSFYNKAIILEDNKKIILESYTTKILQYNKKTKDIKFLTKNINNFTATTNRHINEFLQQFTNIEKLTKKQILKLANIKNN